MAGTKGMSWKWKLLIVFVVLALGVFGFIFTPVGHTVMEGWIRKAYRECPPEQRATHGSADYWLKLAYWEGTICGQDEKARKLYQEFLGILPTDGKSFFEHYKSNHTPKWTGFFDPKENKQYPGWGFLHPRAPEAYFEYLKLYQGKESSQFTSFEGANYHTLFYEMYPIFTKTQKVHPKFYVYWDRVANWIDRKFVEIPPVRPKPADMEGPPSD